PEGQQQIRDNLRVYKENASYFMEALNAAGIWYTGGKNSPYIWMKCPDGMSGWEFFDYLLREIQVVGIPGDGFGECGKGYFRFSTFGKPEETKEAAQRLTKLLKNER
ncbi:MAG: aminotransferase class I/II-fold pyridoxal phosphate-dependent enzyme, partial [Clostridia bacterium]|nr:aminotransferase class I/II-fold pyridoxal phosphate-dependent enzyme [Clostridia bacterium]